MSSHQNSDFIRDIPMEIHSSFFPAPSVVLPSITIRRPRQCEYDFSTERSAVLKYEEQRRLQEERQSQSEKARPKSASPQSEALAQPAASAAPSSSQSVPVAQLWKPSSSAELSAVRNTQAAAKVDGRAFRSAYLSEFETPVNIFDKLEIECLDDRAELEKILNLSSSQDDTSSTTSEESRPSTVANATPPATAIPPLAPNRYPGLANCEFPDLRAATKRSTPKPAPAEKSPIQSNPRAARLLREGHSEAVILACLLSLNPLQMKLLEHYVKATDALVAQGLAPPACVKVLQELGDTDQKRVVSVSENIVQLCGMGFDRIRVMEAFRKASGARQAALDILLSH